MAKRKVGGRGKSRGRPRTRSWRGWLFRFVALRLILVIVIVALLLWRWPAISSWADNVAMGTLEQLGWGLILIVLALGILAGITWRRKLSLLIYHWNQWLGGIAFILAIWGILALFPGQGELRQASLGGNFGLKIIGQQNAIGILRILGWVIVGIVLVAPGVSFRLTASFISWFSRQFERRPAPIPVPPLKPELPQAAVTPKIQRIEPERPAPPRVEPERETAPPTVISPNQAQQELKQVAQEVWKKYGESSALVTVDGWRLPPVDILDRIPEIEFSEADNVQRAKLIEDALSSYGVEAKVVQINVGPTVTQFGLEPGWDRKLKEIKERDRDGNIKVRLEEVSKTRVKVDRITSLSNDLALALAAPSIRIEAPVPGKSVVGIEVPNTITSVVSLRSVVETSAFQKMEARSKLSLALGKAAGGEGVIADLTKMPHMLIAGATGSGKTVCLNSVICCLMLYNTPSELRFIMIDPKRVELTPYNSIPHLATPVIVDTKKALSSLRWLSQEMDKRYQVLAAARARNIEAYNKNKPLGEALPYLVLVIDELADLMMTSPDEAEHILCRLAQLARATGIHLIVATQRPSVDVVTGLIKANFPTRLSFAVTSQVDSRTILDIGGAEKLLGRGDMLYMPTEAGKPRRLQGCFVSDAEMERLVYFWGSQRREEEAGLKLEELVKPVSGDVKEIPDDPLLEAARQLAEEHEHISTSFLQRRLRIGYPRAARIMEQLEEEMAEDEGGEEGEGEI